jgi:4-diphosphocytidyl-2-C-methyl-D-erythritol kinase
MVERSVTVVVPAKINLHLGVGPVRADGYHDLATVFHAINVSDTVTATESLGSVAGVQISVEGEGAQFVPKDSSNLMAAAAVLLAQHHGISPHVTLHVNKRIPVAGGMAGGSADAAGALLACDSLWQTHTPKIELDSLAAQLGSDVPFALHGGTSMGTGRGEVLTPVMSTGVFHWVVAFSDGGLSTPRVYSECDRLRAQSKSDVAIPTEIPTVPEALLQALRAGDPEKLAPELSNDLQIPAISLKPSLQRVLDTGVELGALAGIVSGSGPTCVFLTRDTNHALDVAARLSGAGVCRTVRTAQGPVPGARVTQSTSN